MFKCRLCYKNAQQRGFYQYCNECVKMVVINARNYQTYTCQSMNCQTYGISKHLQHFDWLPDGHCIYSISKRGKLTFMKLCAHCHSKVLMIDYEIYELKLQRGAITSDSKEMILY